MTQNATLQSGNLFANFKIQRRQSRENALFFGQETIPDEQLELTGVDGFMKFGKEINDKHVSYNIEHNV